MMQRPVMHVLRMFGKGPVVDVSRHALKWRLDIQEGIDFSIFLLGSFERSTLRAYSRIVKSGDTILDIGANIGAHTLHLGKMAGPAGQVFAFEPTDFAYNKLLENISLNPGIADRIHPVQAMLAEEDSGELPEIYSSWPLEKATDLHAQHLGRLKTTNGARRMTLDSFLISRGVEKVNLIKMDIDGYETTALRGAGETLAKHRPPIVMELAPYVLDETGTSIEELVDILAGAGYGFRDLTSGKPLPSDPKQLRALIPNGSSRNVFAICQE